MTRHLLEEQGILRITSFARNTIILAEIVMALFCAYTFNIIVTAEPSVYFYTENKIFWIRSLYYFTVIYLIIRASFLCFWKNNSLSINILYHIFCLTHWTYIDMYVCTNTFSLSAADFHRALNCKNVHLFVFNTYCPSDVIQQFILII